MNPIRVMIVDDSLIVRKLVEDSLREAPGIVVVGNAANGRQALERVGTLAPDVITLDVEMPELDGLATLRRLRAEHPRIHVIMFSSLTKRAATATLDALAAGAADYVAKPTAGGMNETRAQIREQLVPKLRALCADSSGARFAASPLGERERALRAPQLVAIGASTGGPAALHDLLARLPAELAVPIVIVQHVPPLFSRLLAERLSVASKRKVEEVTKPVMLAPGQVWIAPGDRHIVVRGSANGNELVLDDGPPVGSCRPSVDVLFQSVAKTFGAEALGVVLTGMGQDGLRGCEAMRKAGARIAVQDQASSVVWGMPGAVARAGVADVVGSITDLAREIATAGRPSNKTGRELVDARG